jgi:hypothetical protein
MNSNPNNPAKILTTDYTDGTDGENKSISYPRYPRNPWLKIFSSSSSAISAVSAVKIPPANRRIIATARLSSPKSDENQMDTDGGKRNTNKILTADYTDNTDKRPISLSHPYHPCHPRLKIFSSSSSAVSAVSAVKIPPRSHLIRHRGFNFIEVLFAVILLGLGFIMIAGVFPVAIQQTTATANETTATLVARDAIRTIQAIADTNGPAFNAVTPNTMFQQTTVGGGIGVYPFSNAGGGVLLSAIGNSCYSTADPRYGWVGFYRRDTVTDPFIQVFVIVLHNDNFADPTYQLYNLPPPVPSSANALNPPPGLPPWNLNNIVQPQSPANPPTLLTAQFAYSTITGSSYAFIYNNNTSATIGPTNPPVLNAVSGAYVLCAADPGNAVAAPYGRAVGEMTGKFFRLGNAITSAALLPPTVAAAAPANIPNVSVFSLQPGSDLKDASEDTTVASGAAQQIPIYIIGAAPDKNTGAFTGPNQDIMAVSAYIRLNTGN